MIQAHFMIKCAATVALASQTIRCYTVASSHSQPLWWALALHRHMYMYM